MESPSAGTAVDDVPLAGAPASAKIRGLGVVPIAPFLPARQAAVDYCRSAGLDYHPPTEYVKVDPDRAARIATEYERMPNAPDDPQVKLAYEKLAAETIAQYKAVLATGLKVEFIDYAAQGDPYAASPRIAIEDVKNNNHFWVFPTSAGFGSNETFDASKNPLLAPTEFTISGKPACVNDLFRVVHDYFGHVKEGNGMRMDGEENAWRSHSAMFSPLARWAMTSETRGQNSWVNFGPQAQHNRTASGADTVYADQKVGLLPKWCMTEASGQPITKVFDPDQLRGADGKWSAGGGSALTGAQLEALERVNSDRTAAQQPTFTVAHATALLNASPAHQSAVFNAINADRVAAGQTPYTERDAQTLLEQHRHETSVAPVSTPAPAATEAPAATPVATDWTPIQQAALDRINARRAADGFPTPYTPEDVQRVIAERGGPARIREGRISSDEAALLPPQPAEPQAPVQPLATGPTPILALNRMAAEAPEVSEKIKKILDKAKAIPFVDTEVNQDPTAGPETRNDWTLIDDSLSPAEREAMLAELTIRKDAFVASEMLDFKPEDHVDVREIVENLALDEPNIRRESCEAIDKVKQLTETEKERVKAAIMAIDTRGPNLDYGTAAIQHVIERVYQFAHPDDLFSGQQPLPGMVRQHNATMRAEHDRFQYAVKALEKMQERAGKLIDKAVAKQTAGAEAKFRGEIDSRYDGVEARHDYLSKFFDAHQDRYTGERNENYCKWGKNGYDQAFVFPTSFNGNYEVWASSMRVFGVDATHIGFKNSRGRYSITGEAGPSGAAEVFRNVTTAVTAYVMHNKPPYITFSAAEQSRSKLYDHLTRTTCAAFPDYLAVVERDGDHSQYGLVRRDHVDEFEAAIKNRPERDKLAVLVKGFTPTNPGTRWAYIDPIVDLRWFSFTGWLPTHDSSGEITKDFDEGKHPRVPAGQPGGGEFGSGGGGQAEKPDTTEADHLDTLIHELRTKGGFTYQPLTEKEPTEGLAVSVHEGRTFAKPLADISHDDVKAFILKNAELLMTNPKAHLGGWVDGKNACIDVAIVLPQDAHDKAVELSNQHDQKAYFDLKNHKVIMVNEHATSGGALKEKGARRGSRKRKV